MNQTFQPGTGRHSPSGEPDGPAKGACLSCHGGQVAGYVWRSTRRAELLEWLPACLACLNAVRPVTLRRYNPIAATAASGLIRPPDMMVVIGQCAKHPQHDVIGSIVNQHSRHRPWRPCCHLCLFEGCEAGIPVRLRPDLTVTDMTWPPPAPQFPADGICALCEATRNATGWRFLPRPREACGKGWQPVCEAHMSGAGVRLNFRRANRYYYAAGKPR